MSVTPHQVEQWILQSNDPSNPSQQFTATSTLYQWMTSSGDDISTTLFQLLQQTSHRPVQFYALTVLGQQRQLTVDQRRALRQYLFTESSSSSSSSYSAAQSPQSARPAFWRNKMAAVLARHMVQDHEWWYTTLETDLVRLAGTDPALYLTVLTMVLQDFQSVSEQAAMNHNHPTEPTTPTTTTTMVTGDPSNQHNVVMTVEDTRRFKNVLKGYHHHHHDPQDIPQVQQSNSSTLLERLFGAVVHIFSTALQQQQQQQNVDHLVQENSTQQQLLLALQCITAFFQWTEVSFLGDHVPKCLELLVWTVQRPTTNSSIISTATCKAALQAWKEWVTSCSTNSGRSNDDDDDDNMPDNGQHAWLNSSIQSVSDPKLPVLCQLLDRIHETGLLPYPPSSTVEPTSSPDKYTPPSSADSVDAETMEVIIAMAVVINATGLEVLPLYEQTVLVAVPKHAAVEALFHQALDLFFRAFAYDDIDVTTAVLPLATRLVAHMHDDDTAARPHNNNNNNKDTTNGGDNNGNRSSSRNNNSNNFDPKRSSGLRQHLPLVLNTLYNQMKYPVDFGYEYENDDDAEELVFRRELGKLYLQIVRVAPTTCLLFLTEAVASHQFAATAEAPAVEATLRLIYHYGEGVRPPPGLKTVLRNETFVRLIVAVHTSDVAQHPHREVVGWYYEMAVRYAGLFLQEPQLLGALLQHMTGAAGLQHPVLRVRSRCCYLLLRLVKATASLLRPLVETAVTGIAGLLSNSALQLQPDDALYLFETIGLLLGQTGLAAVDQQRYLTTVLTPHVHSMERVLAQQHYRHEARIDGDDDAEQILSGSIAAMAHLSKGFSRKPAEELKVVLTETLHITACVLEALPSSEHVRNKALVLLQRMIACIGPNVLPVAPRFLHVLVEHCDSDDILFVSQVFNQLCIKFKGQAVPVVDASLLPFLDKCSRLAQVSEETSTGSDHVPPHLHTEQLQVQKLAYTVLQHIVSAHATAVLVSPANAPSLERVLQLMCDGATRVYDPVIRKTCLRFFRELVSQWTVPASAVNDANLSVLSAFFRQSLVPSVWASMMDPSFDERDAQRSRVVAEFAHTLTAVGPETELYKQCIHQLQHSLSSFELRDALGRAATVGTANGMEASLLEILNSVKRTRV